MDYRIDAEERARFKRCRREWDFGSPHRRDLVPAGAVEESVAGAIKDALAVYYYPGTWDWEHTLKQSLVHKALERSIAADDSDILHQAIALLDCYDAWACTVDDFAPVKIGQDVSGLVPDPYEPERGLLAPDGSGVIYACRVDLLAVDAADEYWVVRHQIVDDWQDPQSLIRDEEALAACWAWEQDYISMQIAGTIHNELRLGAPQRFPDAETDRPRRQSVGQHEPSGGGRSIPQHRRVAAAQAQTTAAIRFDQQTAGVLRRTRIRRRRDEIDAVGIQLATEAGDMAMEPVVYPSPAAHCAACDFNAPCLAMFEGDDPEPMLSDRFRRRTAADQGRPRLGQATWGFGRGAAPPQWT